ncbi:MAG: NAD(P)-dependent oxidoreductase, partial [Deferribacterales bacterium]|nr:NAD(P)-dependent oxidoreductase [Deferribacterales bacterium]
MKIIITGGKGMLGRTLQKRLKSHDIIVADKDVLDITDCVSVDSFVKDCKPEAIIHCAAMTNVDACESNIDDAFRVNAIGSLNIASSCNKYHAKLIAVSTDYVFEGTKKEPYNEYDTPNPMTVYGKSKFAGEQAVRTHCSNHIIARISWLYGSGGPSFIHTMMKLADGSRDELKIVDD